MKSYSLHTLLLIFLSTPHAALTIENPMSSLYKKNIHERIQLVQAAAKLSCEETALLEHSIMPWADHMVENALGTLSLPLGIAPYFLINGKEYLVPMVTEEPSVIAAASYGAKLARHSGGFICSSTEPIMIGQILCTGTTAIDRSEIDSLIQRHKPELLTIANQCHPHLVEHGGGATDIQTRYIQMPRGPALVLHLLVNVQDAMGANIVNTMLETLSPHIEKLIPLKCAVKIVSNLALFSMVKASTVWKKEDLGAETIEKILDLYAFALADPFRCATHNKGIMNGIDAVAIATGNDFRAIEASAHAFAAYQHNYSPLTRFSLTAAGDLKGEIEVPLSVGIVGGSIHTNPTTHLCLKILDVTTARELASVMAAVGLAQNFAAMKALVTTGIQAGHMKLHSRNIAVTAQVPDAYSETVALKMCEENNISVQRAQELAASFALQHV